eukprot:171038-Prymnesium_polylepis.1
MHVKRAIHARCIHERLLVLSPSCARSGENELSERKPADTVSMQVSFIVQYFDKPRMLAAIAGRLQHPALELIVHADSNTPCDRPALLAVARRFSNVRVLRSNNVHEVRGYNFAARAANGSLL